MGNKHSGIASFSVNNIRLTLFVFAVLGLSACVQPELPREKTLLLAAQKNKSDTFTVQMLGINDFHGQVLSVNGEGGMFELSRHLLHAIENTKEHSFVLHAGDHVGASPAESALLQDEPAIEFLNIVQHHCQTHRDNTCEVIGTTGNHEFDEGSAEMLRLLQGGNHVKGPFIHANWSGANYTTLSANVVDKQTNQRLLKPYTTSTVNGVTIGFIGIALDITPELVVPGIVDNLVFKDQAVTVTEISAELQAQGIETIVVIVHDGSEETPYEGITRTAQSLPLDSGFGQFLQALPSSVDLVVSGHSHEFTNTYVKNSQGKNILVTQAFDQGRAYADISLTVSRQSKDVIHAAAQIMPVKEQNQFAETPTMQQSLQKIQRNVTESSNFSRQYTQTYINTFAPRNADVSLGQFIAQSVKYVLKTDVAVMNEGGVRADLETGDVSWGDLFAIQPFGNNLVVRRYTTQQLAQLVDSGHFWSRGTRINTQGQLLVNGKIAAADALHTVGGNGYIMYTQAFAVGKQLQVGGLDIDATIDYIKRLPTPFSFGDTPEQ